MWTKREKEQHTEMRAVFPANENDKTVLSFRIRVTVVILMNLNDK